LVLGVWVFLFLGAVFGLVLNVPVAKASGTIYIRADGSIDPPIAPIFSSDNVTYTFTDNIYDGIVVERDNIIVDGAGYTVQGSGTVTGVTLSLRSNVTVRDMEITGFIYGFSLYYSTGNTISGNNITNNTVGISFGVGASNNKLYHNSFIDNNLHVDIVYGGGANFWDNDYPSCGNYWSDYTGVDANRDGIGDTPYTIDEDNEDRYPFMSPYETVAPATSEDYDDLWHTNDFTVTLSATDIGSGVAETYYKINDGQNRTVSAYGQPLITTEGADNKLEYWSVDKTGNEEPHKVLTEIKLDKTPPTGSITINNEATYTTSTSVTLDLTATDATSGVHQIRLTSDGTWDTEQWESPSPTKTWTLPSGDGTKTVYYQIEDNAGSISTTYSDTIILDTAPPAGFIIIAEGAAYTNSTSVTLILSASDGTSGVHQMRFSDDNTTWSDWESYATSCSWILPIGNGFKKVYVQYRDNAGLVSLSYEDTVTLDTAKPTANAGQDRTVNVGASVSFDAGGSTDNVGIASYEWNFGDGTIGTGKTTTHTYANPDTYTVTLTVRDAAGNTATDTVAVTAHSAEVNPAPVDLFPIAVAAIAVAAAAILLWKRRKNPT